MEVKIKLLHPNARMPEYKTDGASGMDLYALEDSWLWGTETRLFITGLSVEIPGGFEAQIRPRSSMTRRGILCHLGTIDSDYRGYIGVVLTNLSASDQRIKAGDRIAQLVIAPVARVEVVQVEELSDTVRGAGGFGSTGR